MDNNHFDAMARRVASDVSRRHVLTSIRVIAAALFVRLSTSPGAAQTSGVILGGICTEASDCGRTGMAMIVCADNGIPADGALTCCVSQGCCSNDADCCGDRRCAPTGDVCSVCADPPFPTRFPGEICFTDEDCVASVVVEISCLDGRCQAPGATTPIRSPGWRLDPEAALATVEELARIEAGAGYDLLYDRMHPDAQAIVPPAAVAGWYADAFAPRGPGAARAVKVRFVDWTWLVTGTIYPDTAEVTYVQDFAEGPPIRDVVRLVMDERGAWRWFFGRDRAFVDEQIANYR
ncbi:MAG: cytochrome P450 [Chloroflexota bacterium]|nr:cytochrome P450 [Chloroflexota bacterium]